MSPLGWHAPHLVDNTDTQYLRDQHWQQCWCLRFSFFFVFISLSMCQSVCLSVDLLRINLKFLNIHNYWLAQLLYVSLVSGLELKTCRMHIKMLRNSSKKSWGGILFRVCNKTASSATEIVIVVMIIMSVTLW